MKRCQQVATVLIAAVSLAAGAIDTAQAQGRFGAFGLEAGNAVFMGAWGILGKLRIYPSAALALFVDGALGTDLFLILAPDRRGLAFSARVYSSGRFTMGFGWTFDR